MVVSMNSRAPVIGCLVLRGFERTEIGGRRWEIEQREQVSLFFYIVLLSRIRSPCSIASRSIRVSPNAGWWDERPESGPDAGALLAAIETGDDEIVGSAMFDDLQPPVAYRHPEVDRAVAAFRDAGALGAIMSGSGPTVVALARHLGHADRIAAAVPGSFVTVCAPPMPPRTMGAPSGVV